MSHINKNIFKEKVFTIFYVNKITRVFTDEARS